MGYIQEMTDKQRSAWIALCYHRKKEANKGSNYAYFNQEEWDRLEIKGYEMFIFKDAWKNDTEATPSELEAKEIVEKLRKDGNYARIICGYIQTKQHVKHYTVIYKSKCKEKI